MKQKNKKTKKQKNKNVAPLIRGVGGFDGFKIKTNFTIKVSDTQGGVRHLRGIIGKIDFKKMDGLVPAIVQDYKTKKVLMLGFMNKEALEKTLESKLVTFWSRSKKRLWQKGEVSNNTLELADIFTDCDNDSLLITAKPNGSTCHLGKVSCFGEVGDSNLGFIEELYDLIANRKKELPKGSYTTSLFKDGIDKIVQKIGEEAAEVVIAGKNNSKQRVVEEGCDLFYHLLVLLAEKQITLKEFISEMEIRNKK